MINPQLTLYSVVKDWMFSPQGSIYLSFLGRKKKRNSADKLLNLFARLLIKRNNQNQVALSISNLGSFRKSYPSSPPLRVIGSLLARQYGVVAGDGIWGQKTSV